MTIRADGAPAAFPGSYPQATPATPPTPDVSAPPPTAVRAAAAGRRTSRRGVIISVLVILVGGLIAYAGGQLLTKHREVLAVAQDVPLGATITTTDLTTASMVQDPNLTPIPSADRSQIVGMIAQVGLVKGELLTRAQVGTGSGFSAGQQLVALPLKQGQFPARGLTPGQKVLIVATPGQGGTGLTGGSAATGSSAGHSAAGTDGTVVDVGATNVATQVTVIDVRVAASDGIGVAQLASTGNLALILLPAGR